MRSAPIVRVDRSLRRGLRVFDADRFRWLDEAAALGPVAGLRFGPVNAWVVSDAALARRMLITDAGRWVRSSQQVVPSRLAVGESLFSRPDRTWQLVQPHLAPQFRAKSLAPLLAGLGGLLADEVGGIPKGTGVNMTVVLHRLALAGAAWVTFGDRLDAARADELVAHQRAVVDWVGSRIGQPTAGIPVAFGRSARMMRQHRAALGAYAAELLAQDSAHERPILAAIRAATRRGGANDDRAATAEILGLLFAGTETTAATVLWAVVHAARDAKQWQRLREDPTSARSYALETLRLTPAAWGLSRTPASRRAVLETGDISQLVRRPLVVSIYLRHINRDPVLWPDPLRFDPDRFESPDPNQLQSLLPFGLGPRSCIGQHLAMAELVALLPLLAQRGDVTIDHEPEEDAQFALRPRDDLIVTFDAPDDRTATGRPR
jgi:cytochrome P450